MMIINCTPHTVNILDDNNNIIRTIEPSGIIPRVSSSSTFVGELDGIPEEETNFGEVFNLPEQKAETIYIVSNLVAQACPERHDFRVPGQQARDDKGRVIGCRSLSRPTTDNMEVVSRLEKCREMLPYTMDIEAANWAASFFEAAQEAILGQILVPLWSSYQG